MYRCTDCEKEFEYVKIVFETHRLDTPPYERHRLCPHCGSSSYERLENTHCRFCGIRLQQPGEYCSDRCRDAGERYYKAQEENIAIFKNSPVAKAVREVADYNKEHKTKYSYGKYFSLKEAGLL